MKNSIKVFYKRCFFGLSMGMVLAGCGMSENKADETSAVSDLTYPLMIVIPVGTVNLSNGLALDGDFAEVTPYVESATGSEDLTAESPVNMPILTEDGVSFIKIPEASINESYTMQVGGDPEKPSALILAPGEVPKFPEGSDSYQVMVEENPLVVRAFKDHPRDGLMEVIRTLVGSMDSTSYVKQEMGEYLRAAASEIRSLSKAHRQELKNSTREINSNFVEILRDPERKASAFTQRKADEYEKVSEFLTKNPELVGRDASKLLQGNTSEVSSVSSKAPASASGAASAEESERRLFEVLMPPSVKPTNELITAIRDTMDYVKAVIISAREVGPTVMDAALTSLKVACDPRNSPTPDSIKRALEEFVRQTPMITSAKLSINLARIKLSGRGG